ncbi:MAG TPA: oligoendopeptidase F, partial [Spirochaetota bacterium]|nr:oligoendopeptidase F [Spirochaetota bacterium]
MDNTVKKIPYRDEIPDNDKWDVTPLFASAEEWEKLYAEIENSIHEYNNFEGKLHQSFSIFLQAIEFDLSISRSLDRLFTYAHLKSDEDTTNQDAQAMLQKAHSLYQRVSEASSFLVP